jgi:hypothetical protein
MLKPWQNHVTTTISMTTLKPPYRQLKTTFKSRYHNHYHDLLKTTLKQLENHVTTTITMTSSKLLSLAPPQNHPNRQNQPTSKPPSNQAAGYSQKKSQFQVTRLVSRSA